MNEVTQGMQVGAVVTYPDLGARAVGTVQDFHHGQVLVAGRWYFADEIEVIGQTMPHAWEVS